MKVSTKVNLKIFFVNVLLFSLVISLWDYLFEGEVDLLKHVIQGVIFGIFMSWYSIAIKKRILKDNGISEFTENDFKASYNIDIANSSSIENAFKILKEYDIDDNWNLTINDSRIEGKTKISWTSWGEKIIITFSNEKINIKSMPRCKIQMIDNGQNRGNVNIISALLKNE